MDAERAAELHLEATYWQELFADVGSILADAIERLNDGD